MKVLNIKNRQGKRENVKHIGFEIPIELASYISLFALHEERTRSAVLRAWIEQNAKATNKTHSEDNLCKELAKRYGGTLYRTWRSKNPDSTFEQFTDLLQEDLKSKGITSTQAYKICTLMYETNKEKSNH